MNGKSSILLLIHGRCFSFDGRARALTLWLLRGICLCFSLACHCNSDLTVARGDPMTCLLAPNTQATVPFSSAFLAVASFFSSFICCCCQRSSASSVLAPAEVSWICCKIPGGTTAAEGRRGFESLVKLRLKDKLALVADQQHRCIRGTRNAAPHFSSRSTCHVYATRMLTISLALARSAPAPDRAQTSLEAAVSPSYTDLTHTQTFHRFG